MQLPTQAQVAAATRHIASVAGGAILMFGLSSKFNPETVKALIEQTGNVVNGIILLVGLAMPAIAAWKASNTASPANQIATVSDIAKDKTAPLAHEAKVALLDATAAQPEVVGTIEVTDKSLEAATQSDQIKAA